MYDTSDVFTLSIILGQHRFTQPITNMINFAHFPIADSQEFLLSIDFLLLS